MKTQMLAMAVAGAAAAVSAELAENVLYRNDFGTRESRFVQPTLGGDWYETPTGIYPVPTVSSPYATLCRSQGSDSSDQFSSMYDAFESVASCDGWYQPFHAKGYKNRACIALLSSGDANPAYTVGHPSVASSPLNGVTLHDLGNEFTNGVLRVVFDVRTPDAWIGAKNGYLHVAPVFRAYMPVMSWGGKNLISEKDASDRYATPGQVGVQRCGTAPLTDVITYTGDGMGSFRDRPAGTWLRLQVDYDLDLSKFTIVGQTIGTDHPTKSTAATAFAQQTKGFRTSVSAETGGVAGLAISSYMQSPDLSFAAVTNKVFVDNFVVSWKKPGAEAFEACYENDFSTCRSRRLSYPDSARVANYPAAAATAVAVKTSFTGYTNYSGGSDNLRSAQIVEDLIQPIDSVVQPVGVDGWRRIAYDGMGNGIAYGGSGRDYAGRSGQNMRIGDSGYYAMLAQTLGEKVTSGKVRMTVDIRVATTNQNTVAAAASRRVYAALGDETLYTACSSEIASSVCTRGGIAFPSPDSADPAAAYAFCTRGSGMERAECTGTSCWYRCETIADLDAKTYDFTMTEIGATGLAMGEQPSGAVVLSRTGVPFENAVSDVSSFAVHGFGTGYDAGSFKHHAYFDNIGVWKGWGTADEKLIYSNDFTCCSRDITSERASSLLAYQYNLDDGPDGWRRVDGTGGANRNTSLTVRGTDSSHCACLSSEAAGTAGQKARFTQALPEEFADSEVVTTTVDVRSPSFFAGASGFAGLELGGRLAARTEWRSGDGDVAVRFGFAEANGTSAAGRYRPTLFAEGSDGKVFPVLSTDVTKWYRFVVRMNQSTKRCRIRVYDQGWTRPVATDDRGSLVADLGEVAYLGAPAAFASLSIVGDKLAYESAGDAGLNGAGLYVGEIKMETPTGLVLIFR